ncbi:DENN domain-containing protein 5B-like isoform X2 [Branchiostoma floridae x Branchiostoma belcheri]
MSEPGQAGTRFADYFVVCGLDVASGLEPDQLQGRSEEENEEAHNLQLTPLERSYNSKVLAHYPENVAWNPFDESAVGMLCLPKGLSFRTENEKRETRFHSFIITREDGSRTYGTSFTFYEKVVDKQICEAMQTLFAMHKAELSNRQSRTVFPLMDRTPPEIGDENERYVPRTYDITSDVLYVTKSICLITPLPFIQACKKFLSQLYEAISSPSQPPLPVESYVYNILYEVPLPPPGRSLQFNAAKGAVTCHRPSANELPLFDFHIREMFTLLGVDSVLQLWTCALLEKHILLYSQDYHRLMLLAESLSVLLFPFTWQHVYVPILPASLLHFLDAPVPYIMGLHHSGRDDRSQLQLPHEASLCFVDIDNHTVELPEDLPQFPKKLDVLQEISEILVRSNVPLEPGMNPPSRSDSGCHLSDDGRTGSPAHTSTLSKRDILESSEAIAKITAIAQRMGVSHTISDIAKSLPEIAAFEKKPKVDHDLEDMKLNAALREIFLHRIASLLLGYESFVIQPNGDLESWFSNREQMTNFDKAAFLSDQPDIYLPFLSPFIETQMFATLVDNKIMANWEPIDDNLKIFDAKIENIKSSRNSHIRMSNPDRSIMVEIQERAITEKWNKVDHMAVHPHLLSMKIGQGRHEPGFFPDLQPDVMCYESGNNSALQDAYSSFFLSPHADEIEWDDYRYTRRNMRQQWRRKERMQQHSQHLAMSTDQREKYIQEARGKLLRQPKLSDMSPAVIAQTNWKFVEGLLKECKVKTKRMLVEKMGSEAVELGHGETSLRGMEENTLIASLCDLLERIWSHGLQTKQGKSALWSHLMAYQEMEETRDRSPESSALSPGTDYNLRPPTDEEEASHDEEDKSYKPKKKNPFKKRPRKKSAEDEGVTVRSSRSTLKVPMASPMMDRRRRSKSPDPISLLPAMKQTVVQDMRSIQSMKEIKTDVGFARTWVRLSIEKKMLSAHLKELLADQELLKSRYKRYAFLRSEEEREQFLYHLLSLNAVDYFCFTNCFTATVIPYRVVIVPSRKFNASTTTAQPWMCLAGEMSDTGIIQLPKNTLEMTFEHKNLGLMTTLRIGHDNSGLMPKWMVEYILVRNEVTGHTYKFQCGRWLGKGVDDGSLERLLVGELLRKPVDTEVRTSWVHQLPSPIEELLKKCRTPPGSRSRSPVGIDLPKIRLALPQIQEMVGDAVNNIVKHFYKPEKERGSLTLLLCGENGLVESLEQVFLYGFKSSRLFRNKFFVWDFIGKVYTYFQSIDSDEEGSQDSVQVRQSRKSLCRLVEKINAHSTSMGKDEKFKLLVCLGARDHLLDQWIPLIVATPVTLSMYEETSFLRDEAMVQFLVSILQSLKEFNILLESSIMSGLDV